MRQKGVGEGTRLLYIVLFVRKKARINYLFEIVQNVTATRRYKISKKIALLFLKRRMLKTCHSFDAIMLYESIGPPQEATVYVFYLLAGNRRTGLSQDKNSKNLEKTKQTKAVFQVFF